MAGNLGKDSMIMNKTLIFNFLVLLIFIQCEEDFEDIPLVPADFPDVVINLRLPEYNNLQIDGGHIVIPNAGIRGIIVHRQSGTEYTAFEINCSYEPGSASANIRVDNSGFSLIDDSCSSRFNITDGNPISGPARSPLRIYVSNLNGDILTITDESANGR